MNLTINKYYDRMEESNGDLEIVHVAVRVYTQMEYVQFL